jgi:hypothetical protein
VCSVLSVCVCVFDVYVLAPRMRAIMNVGRTHARRIVCLHVMCAYVVHVQVKHDIRTLASSKFDQNA